MKVFVTGGSGHLGSVVIPDLLANGHHVIGLARSERSAARLTELGAAVVLGDLDDLDSLQSAATGADGVIHLAFKTDDVLAGNIESAIAADARAVRCLGQALTDTGKPLVATSATLLLTSLELDRAYTEDDFIAEGPRVDAENAAIALAGDNVRSSVIRVPPITHSELDTAGWAHVLVRTAREAGMSGYPGDGLNRWPAGHSVDVGKLYRLALENAPAGSRLHATAETGLTIKSIAEIIGKRLDLPAVSIPADDIASHFGVLAPLITQDDPVDSTKTQRLVGWAPTHPTLFEDFELDYYFHG